MCKDFDSGGEGLYTNLDNSPSSVYTQEEEGKRDESYHPNENCSGNPGGSSKEEHREEEPPPFIEIQTEHRGESPSNLAFQNTARVELQETPSSLEELHEGLNDKPISVANSHPDSQVLGRSGDEEKILPSDSQEYQDANLGRSQRPRRHNKNWEPRDNSESSMKTEDNNPSTTQFKDSSPDSKTSCMPKKNLTLMRKLEKLKVSTKRGRPKKISSKKTNRHFEIPERYRAPL